MNKPLIPRKSLLLVALLLFIGCASNSSFNTNRNKQIDISVELINKVYSLIIRDYYKPVSVSSMLFGSIKGMENLVGDTGFLIIEDGQPKMFNPRIHETMDQEEIDLKITPYEGLGIFEEIYLLTIENKPEYSPESIAYAALDGLVQSLDPNSALLPPEAFEDFGKDSKRKYTGIGINMQMKDGFVTVISVIGDTPAMRSDIRTGDRIISIDGKPVIYLWQAVKLIRGPEGTKVMVSVMRTGNNEPLAFMMVRDVLSPAKIKAIPLVPGYGYVRLSSFPKGTATQLEKILGELEIWRDPLQGLILDLRNNGGGLLKEAIKVTDLFLQEGKISTIRGRKARNTKTWMATPNPIKHSYSMVVLINEGSAATSEIVAGALQDQKRALILGTKSQGRGSIQSVETLPDGSGLKLTIALCYTPNGRSIQDRAIEPDMVVKRNFVSHKDYFYIDHPLLTKEGPEDLLSIEIKIIADNQVKRALEFLIQNNELKLDV